MAGSSRPAKAPKVFGAALTTETAKWAGEWADGLITVAKEPDDFKETLAAFHEGGGAGKPVYVQAAISYASNEADAVRAAHQNWPMAGLDLPLLADLPTPEDFAEKCASVSQEEVKEKLRVSADLSQHIDWIARDLELGATRVYLQYVGPDMRQFIETFGQEVLPKFASPPSKEATLAGERG